MQQHKSRYTRVYLEENYEPLTKDVACGRGADFYFHPGNIAFRNVLYHNLDRYCVSSTKLEKSQIVAEILHALHATDHEPVKFIRFDNRKQRWYILDEEAAKQKIGQSIREIIYRRHPKPLVVKKANVRTIKYVAKAMVERLRGNANDTFEFTESAPVLEISGHYKNGLVVRHGNTGEGARSEDFSLDNIPVRYDSTSLESSREWFTIGGLSQEDCSDVVDIIDDVF
jgi:hypothetical protein